jgi:enamine deaminase RidA (YjgF/YER057c/UK114 family)
MLGLLLTILPCAAALGDEPRLSIGGYDPVAYFTEGRPVPGKPDYEYVWHKLRWHFASSEHREMFSRDPEHYAPQYDGYCAMGAALGAAAHKDTPDPFAWTIVDGKLYLVHESYWLEKWREKALEYIKKADADWKAVKELPPPEIVGPPCASSPPTTAVVSQDGRRWVMVGPQVPRDASGSLVGKGDLGTQIQQVGENVGVCLKAGGVTPENIVFTVNQVRDPAELGRHAELLQRYFGPPSPATITERKPQLSDPDYLLQVEAIAATK